jgi:alginate O-acetyltransferase complex protein AlgJ
VRLALVGWLGASGERVYRGHHGWLYLRTAVDSITGDGFLDPRVLAERAADGVQPDPRRAVQALAAELGERGIRLLVVPVPGKASVHHEPLAILGAPQGPPRNRSFAGLVRDLEAMGVEVLDPLPRLAAVRDSGRDAFLEHDSHWSPAGMAAVARGIAEHISDHGWVTPPLAARYRRRPTRVSGGGDLTGMLQVPTPSRWFPLQRVVIEQVETVDGQPWSAHPEAEVLVLGDSFANVFHLDALGWGAHAGLAEHLGWELQAPVDLVAVNGDGAFASRRALGELRAWGDDRLDGTRVVVWVFAERELAFGDWRLLGP